MENWKNYCSTLCDVTNCMTGFPVLHYLPGFVQTLVLWISDAIQRLILCHSPFPCCPQSFPASESYPMSQLFALGGQSIGASTSALVLPMNIQRSFPLGLTGLILLSNGLSRVFSASQFKSINSSALSLLYGPILTSVHDYWKNHRFDYMDICQQSDVSAF